MLINLLETDEIKCKVNNTSTTHSCFVFFFCLSAVLFSSFLTHWPVVVVVVVVVMVVVVVLLLLLFFFSSFSNVFVFVFFSFAFIVVFYVLVFFAFSLFGIVKALTCCTVLGPRMNCVLRDLN